MEEPRKEGIIREIVNLTPGEFWYDDGDLRRVVPSSIDVGINRIVANFNVAEELRAGHEIFITVVIPDSKDADLAKHEVSNALIGRLNARDLRGRVNVNTLFEVLKTRDIDSRRHARYAKAA